MKPWLATKTAMGGVRWTDEQYRAYLAGAHRAAVCAPDPEPPRRAAAKAKAAAKEVHPRFRIAIHHRTRRLSDCTGRSHKAAVDGIVRGGILGDDSPEWVESITETYERAEEEQTVIEVWEIGR